MYGVRRDPASAHLIARSLLTTWRRLHTLPALDGRQYELRDGNYSRAAGDIELLWLTVLRTLILESGQPFVRLCPWPQRTTFALSLRYDIDRSTTGAQVERIIQLQQRRLGGMCGSWYAFEDDAHALPIRAALAAHAQEIGRHALHANEAVNGVGVTFHSAPTSSYWRGRETIAALESGGARCAEMLAAQLCTPRPGWIHTPRGGRATAMPLTPLHFPLEGSTADTSLDYFDRQLPAFRRQRDRGGHVIIASHPDLNQDILEQLLEREDFTGAWCAAIGDVVDRCEQVMTEGRVQLVRDTNAGSFALVASRDITSLQVLIDDGRTVRTESITLHAARPAPLP